MLGALVNIVGAILQSTAFSLGQLIVGRLVSGFGFGHLTATAPNWQAECSGADHRGAVVLLESVFISAGLAIAAWITFGTSYASGSVTWRFPLALSAFWSLIILFNTPHMPESPRWLLRKGKTDEARRTLAALKSVSEDDSSISEEILEIEESLTLAGQAKFLDIFKNGEERLFHRTCLAAAGQMFQQMYEAHLRDVFSVRCMNIMLTIIPGRVSTHSPSIKPRSSKMISDYLPKLLES